MSTMKKLELTGVSADLARRIQDRTATVAVVGMGYVGLPLAVEFARSGLSVVGVDVSDDRIDRINRGESYIGDVDQMELADLVSSGKLRASKPGPCLGEADAVSICVPTPLRKSKDPDISYIVSATDELARHVRPGQLIVLESTTYPGTTDEIIRTRLEKNGLVVGENLFLCFSPERVDPGNPDFNTRNTPKVVGGVTPVCSELARQLYSLAVNEVVPVSGTATAEMVKLLENTFRSVNIGLVNELAIICEKLGVEVWEVIRAAATKPFGFMPFWPGPGLGGHCIPIDPHYLSWKLKTLNYHARFIELADEINSSMPTYVVDRVAEALNDHSRSVRGSRILVLGVAYKKDVADCRESPAIDVIAKLKDRGGEVVFADPHVEQFVVNGESVERVPFDTDQLKSANCVVIVTNHSEFKAEVIVENSVLVVDTRNVTGPLGSHDNVRKL